MAGYKTPKRPRKTRRNPFMVTTGGQSVPYQPDELEGTWQATAKHAQRHEEKGTRYRVQKMQDGHWHLVDATTGQPTGKYGTSAERAQQLLGKFLRRTNPRRNPSPVPGISVEEVIADIDGQEWANWDLNRAGIMHWRGNPWRR